MRHPPRRVVHGRQQGEYPQAVTEIQDRSRAPQPLGHALQPCSGVALLHDAGGLRLHVLDNPRGVEGGNTHAWGARSGAHYEHGSDVCRRLWDPVRPERETDHSSVKPLTVDVCVVSECPHWQGSVLEGGSTLALRPDVPDLYQRPAPDPKRIVGAQDGSWANGPRL